MLILLLPTILPMDQLVLLAIMARVAIIPEELIILILQWVWGMAPNPT